MVKIGPTGGGALIVAAMATTVAGCSTKPRNFAASVSTPVTNRAAFEQDYRTCESLVRAGHIGGFRGAASNAVANAGMVSSAMAAGATIGTTGATTTGWGGIGVAAGPALAAATVFGGIAGLGLSRAIRGGREKRMKRSMSACLSEYGFEVAKWEKLKKREDAAAAAARKVTLVDAGTTPLVVPVEIEGEPEIAVLAVPGT